MDDLLNKECVVISNKRALLNICHKYRIPNLDISVSMSDMHDGTKYPFLISRGGIRNIDNSVSPDLIVFKSLDSLKQYLFKYALFHGRVVVYKDDYQTYLKTIRLLRKIGIKTIKDKTYYEEADQFYCIGGYFKELSYFGCKCVVSITNGIQFKGDEFLEALKEFIKYKDKYKKQITYYLENFGDRLC